MKRKIYIASSWKNANFVRALATALRCEGHRVFDFTDKKHRPKGFDTFVFNGNEWKGKALDKMEYKEFLEYPESKRAFKGDKAGLDWADTVILLLPSGRSSHLEAGYGVGCGKDLFIYGDLPLGEFDAMYGFAKACFHVGDETELFNALLFGERDQ
jgi:hypothetical protein